MSPASSFSVFPARISHCHNNFHSFTVNDGKVHHYSSLTTTMQFTGILLLSVCILSAAILISTSIRLVDILSWIWRQKTVVYVRTSSDVFVVKSGTTLVCSRRHFIVSYLKKKTAFHVKRLLADDS